MAVLSYFGVVCCGTEQWENMLLVFSVNQDPHCEVRVFKYAESRTIYRWRIGFGCWDLPRYFQKCVFFKFSQSRGLSNNDSPTAWFPIAIPTPTHRNQASLHKGRLQDRAGWTQEEPGTSCISKNVRKVKNRRRMPEIREDLRVSSTKHGIILNTRISNTL